MARVLKIWPIIWNKIHKFIWNTQVEDFIAGLAKEGVEVNRKMLADLAVNDTAAFAKLVEVAKNA